MSLSKDVLIKTFADGLKSGRLGIIDVLSYLQSNKKDALLNNNDFWKRMLIAKSGDVAARIARQTFGSDVNYLRYMLSSWASTQVQVKKDNQTIAVTLKRNRPDNGVPVYLQFATTYMGMHSDFTYGLGVMNTDPFFKDLYETQRFVNIRVFNPQYRIFWTRNMESDALGIFYTLLNSGS